MKNLILFFICLSFLLQGAQLARASEENFPLSDLNQAEMDWIVPYSAPALVDDAVVQAQLRDRILSDFRNRMSEPFKIPGTLRARTEFWFDIYTRYGQSDHVIHHSRFPWIVFKVVNTTDLMLLGKGPKWLRTERGNKLAAKELKNVRLALSNLTRKSPAKYNSLELELADKLKSVPGSRTKVYREAAASVRSQLGQKDFFTNGLVNSSRYLPYMEEIFRQMDLPIELTRMPFVESSFNEKAFSKVGASGIWQIMPQTGKQYMMVNPLVDERNSPLKATKTAARLLHSYFKALHYNWPLTITSYNHGIGNIQKAIRATRSTDLPTIIANYNRGDFKFASSNFFTCFLAALYAERYHDMMFRNVPRLPVMEREVVKLTGRTSILQIQRLTGLDHRELMKYNLDLKISRGSVLPRGYNLHLPPGFREKFLRQVGQRERGLPLNG
jgi:membrane-bound lytic murein transglycosylase D